MTYLLPVRLPYRRVRLPHNSRFHLRARRENCFRGRLSPRPRLKWRYLPKHRSPKCPGCLRVNVIYLNVVLGYSPPCLLRRYSRHAPPWRLRHLLPLVWSGYAALYRRLLRLLRLVRLRLVIVCWHFAARWNSNKPRLRLLHNHGL